MNDKLAAQKYNNYAFHEPEAVIMPQVKESRDAHLAVTSMLDTCEQALATSEGPSSASDRGADELADNFDPLGLFDDPKTVARSAMTSLLDYYVQAVVTRGTPSAAFDHVAVQVADQLDVLLPEATYDWLGYNRLPEDAREPLQAKSNKAEKTAPTLANDPEVAAVLKENETAHNRLAITSVLDYYVQDLVINESPSVAPDRVADNWTAKLDVPKPEITYDWLGYNRLPEINLPEINTVENADDNNDPAINTLDDSAGEVSDIKTQENTDDHNVQTMEVIPDNCGRTSTSAVEFPADDQISGRVPANVWNSRANHCGYDETCTYAPDNKFSATTPPQARYASHPNIQPAVRSSAPRPDTDNQPPDTTDRTENNTTAVRSLAPRPWHATVRLNKTTSWRPRPLCYIGLMTHIILLLLHSGDGGVEPCSPPANTTNQTTYQNITTHYGMANGGAERRSPPTMPTMTTVRSPAPRPCHYPNHTVTAAQFSAQELHRRPDIHPVLHVTPLPSHTPHCSRTRNCRNTAFSQRSTPPSQPHPVWRCRSVIVSGAGPPVCLPATGSVKGIKHALHHLTPHLPPPQHQRLFYQGQLLGDHDPTPTTTTTGPIHLTLRLVGLKGGGRRSRRDTDSDSTSDNDSDSHSRRKKSRKRSSKGELIQALRAMTSLADSVAGICRSIQQPQQTVTPEAPAPQRSADKHSDQARTQAEPSQEEAAPQARRRYCVSIDTRQGERQVSLQEPGQQPQHSPLCPPTPVAVPLRF